ncbi:MAG: peptidoglycan-binding protein [Rhizobium sp.]|nr:peptidoglycan-binding protein [Rhizobium sp.]
MSLPKYFNVLMASAVSLSIAATPIGFTPAMAQSAPAAEAPGDSGWQKEFEMWRDSNKGGKVADYQKYLRTYPNGKFANVAKRRVEELNAAVQAPAPGDETAAVADATKNVADDGKRDLEMWRQVSKSGTMADYETYLKEFPQGKFAKVAKTRIENLTATAPADQTEADVATQDTQDAAPAEDAQDQAQADVQDEAQDQAEASEDQPDAAADTAQSDEQPQGGADWEQEYALWKAASDGNTVTEYEAYLKTYPDGKFAAIAQARIAQLAAAETPDPTIAEGDQQDDAATAKNNGNRRKTNDQAAQQESDQEPADDQAQSQDMDQADPQDDQQADNNVGARKNNPGAQDQAQFTEGSPDTEDASLDRETRLEIQGRLSSLGYDTLGTDGVFGNRSRDAIASWQQDSGAPVTGYLSDDQVEAIFVASAATYATWLASRVPVRVHRVRPRAEWVVVRPRANIRVINRRPAVVVVKPFKNRFKARTKVKIRFNGGCRKKRRC